MESLVPISTYTKDQTCFLSQEPEAHAHFLSPTGIPLVSNAIMGCVAGHPFFEYIIQNLNANAGLYGWNDVLTATGPYMLTDMYRKYNTKGTFWGEEHPVTLAEADEFQPSFDNSMVDKMRQMCINSQGKEFPSDEFGRKQTELCRAVIGYDFKSSPADSSFTNHHWTHSWAGKINDPWGVHNARHVFDVQKDLKDGIDGLLNM